MAERRKAVALGRSDDSPSGRGTVAETFLRFIATLKYLLILMKVLIGSIDSTSWRQKVNNVLNYMYSKISMSRQEVSHHFSPMLQAEDAAYPRPTNAAALRLSATLAAPLPPAVVATLLQCSPSFRARSNK
ncbi:hypothetical protein PIB30_001357 [Stylosanthes scabra]|uniref:Uncharacterized protein n=1 Tax=Stylosanthes scabra TaxID=79078 RepID=A0ABU6Y1J3_9FABA|nr:hypothetical protein [Stylosanthes scabra]